MEILKLMRIENCVMAGIAVGIGFLVAGGNALSAGLVLAVVSAFLITGAGNTINDYYDRYADKKNAPDRPIPSGAVSPGRALFLAVVLFVLGANIAYHINLWCWVMAVVNTLLLFFYAAKLKSTVLIGNVVVSYLTASTFVYGALVIGDVSTAIILASLVFLVNIGREIIGGIEDMEGDRKTGITTFATRNGARVSWFWGRVFILGAFLISPLPYFMGMMSVYYLMAVFVADVLFLNAIITNDARLNQRLTKIAMFIGLVAFVMGTAF